MLELDSALVRCHRKEYQVDFIGVPLRAKNLISCIQAAYVRIVISGCAISYNIVKRKTSYNRTQTAIKTAQVRQDVVRNKFAFNSGGGVK